MSINKNKKIKESFILNEKYSKDIQLEKIKKLSQQKSIEQNISKNMIYRKNSIESKQLTGKSFDEPKDNVTILNKEVELDKKAVKELFLLNNIYVNNELDENKEKYKTKTEIISKLREDIDKNDNVLGKK